MFMIGGAVIKGVQAAGPLVTLAGSGLIITDAVTVAQQVDIRHPATYPTGGVGLIMAFTGLLMYLLPWMSAQIDKILADRRERRNLEGRLKEAEDKANVAEQRANLAADKATVAEHRLVALERKQGAATVERAALQGKQEGVEAVLEAGGILRGPARTGHQDGMPRPTLLIVEDDPETAKAYSKLFTARGFSTSSAGTVEEAVRRLDGRPHWMLLDLKLADGDGVEVLRAARRAGMTTKVAVITAQDDRDVLEAVRSLNPDHLFLKPLERLDLLTDAIRMEAAGPSEDRP
jgi:CheY-like chemotaxis protein/Na+-transporting methylmalonyl-CoA/oxaloacetate decarboxylase gamma subunit